MLTFEDYKDKHWPFASEARARKMYNKYVEIENTVKDCCQADPKPPFQTIDICWNTNSLSTFNIPVPTCKPEYAAAAKCGWGKKAECVEKEQGNKPMTDTEISRNYLVTRLDSVSRTKRNDLPNIFNLYAPTSPKTYKELIDWIKNDKFTIDKKVAKRIDSALNDEDGGGVYYGSFLNGIVWTGAEKVPDPDGYNAAEKERIVKAQAVKDVIYTADAATALKALQDFEAWTPTSTTTVQ